jgi:aryl-alcohol dehydrogenase-like predicted oxidoreductase
VAAGNDELGRRELGQTGLNVSVLSLGTAGLGGVYGNTDERTGVATALRAFDLGITTFDSSPYYGNTRSETVLGKALAQLPREDVVVMTKCGRYGATDFDFSPARIKSSVDESLQRLQIETLDVLFVHDIEFGDLDRILDESVATLHELKACGKARAVGITGLPLHVFHTAMDRGVQLDAILSYCHGTLFDDSLQTLLPRCHERRIGVVNGSPAAMGLLSSRGPQSWHPADAEIQGLCAQAAQHAASRGAELATLALQFACDLPGVATTLCGATTPAELEHSVRAVATPLDRTLLAEVESILQPIRGRTWLQGRPENNG